ncbi:MAG TPA: response regulator [Pelovirga sp.]|nr:response regulator [Pelovirga sp.]
MNKGEPIVILLAEDDPAHAEIIRRTLKSSRIANRMEHVNDGQQALDYLYQRERFTDPDLAPRPGLILLDLRMPRIDGLDVLRQIKSDADLTRIPTVILTTSAAESDMAKAYEAHANSYLVKPVDFNKFTSMMETVGYYWLMWNCNP